ncbi:MAG: NAD(P)H-hydrate dehydratase [Pseudanabaena sp. ELA607]
MEKVAQKITQHFQRLYPQQHFPRIGILVGVGHNGGDALVVARELWHQGYQVQLCFPINRNPKPLTKVHGCYARYLGIPSGSWQELATCDVLLDGVFGFGLEREIHGALAEIFTAINQWHKPLVSIDLPSGIHTDTGAVMGVALKARHTFCLGMWKRGVLAESAVPYVGELIGINFDIPQSTLQQHLGQNHELWRIAPAAVLGQLAQTQRQVLGHKYSQGGVLLVVGSLQYAGAALLAAAAARATGVGMMTVCVPQSLRYFILERLPDALVLGCPETPTGAIQQLPDLTHQLQRQRYQAIVCGCGLSLDAPPVIKEVLHLSATYAVPLVLDADGLTLLSEQLSLIAPSSEPPLQLPPHLVLTPHWGEFQRLFPTITEPHQGGDRFTQLRTALRQLSPFIPASITILLKGARTIIGSIRQNQADSLRLAVNPESTPALARGGTGDVLAGMIGGLIAQGAAPDQAAIQATVWHSQTAIALAKTHTQRGVTPLDLVEHLLPFLAGICTELF